MTNKSDKTNMKIIVGLGNPGKKYQNTRHNAGFLALEAIIKTPKLQNSKTPNKFKFQKKFNAEILNLKSYNLNLLLVKPQTFMNESGQAVKKVLQYNHLAIQQFNNLYVIHDDLDIKLGEYKIQFAKGPKQHNGVKSIEDYLKTKAFWRVRVGVEKRMSDVRYKMSGDQYVLQKFSKKEKEIIEKTIEAAAEKLLTRTNAS